MIQHIVLGVLIVLVFWTISPLLWILLLLLLTAFRSPGELVLNQHNIERSIVDLLSEDGVFTVLRLPLTLIWNILEWTGLKKRDES